MGTGASFQSARGMDLGEIDLRDDARRPCTCLVGDIVVEEVLQVLGQLLPALGRKGRPPRPRYAGGKVGHAADATSPYRRASALFDRTRLEDDGVSCRGRQRGRPLSEAGPGERSFQLLACRLHRVALFMEGDALLTPNSYRLVVAAMRPSVRWHFTDSVIVAAYWGIAGMAAVAASCTAVISAYDLAARRHMWSCARP